MLTVVWGSGGDDASPACLRLRHGVPGGPLVVAEARSASEVLREAARHRPDVLVLDLRLGGTGRVIRKAGVAVLVLTASGDDLVAAMRAGARGCLHPGAEPADVARAIRGVAAGEVIFGPLVAGRLGELVGANRVPARAPDWAAMITRARAVSLSRIAS